MILIGLKMYFEFKIFRSKLDIVICEFLRKFKTRT